MFEQMMKSIMPPGFDMDKAMKAVQDVAARIVRTDEATQAQAARLGAIEAKLDRILKGMEGKDNG